MDTGEEAGLSADSGASSLPGKFVSWQLHLIDSTHLFPVGPIRILLSGQSAADVVSGAD